MELMHFGNLFKNIKESMLSQYLQLKEFFFISNIKYQIQHQIIYQTFWLNFKQFQNNNVIRE